MPRQSTYQAADRDVVCPACRGAGQVVDPGSNPGQPVLMVCLGCDGAGRVSAARARRVEAAQARRARSAHRAT